MPQFVGATVRLYLLLMWHEAQGTLAWPWVNRKPVVLWSKVDVVQLTVLWQLVQLAVANVGPAEECVGLLVCCQVVRWQPELPQSVGAMVRL